MTVARYAGDCTDACRGRRSWKVPLAGILVLAVWCLQFWPLFARHENLLGYGLMDPRVVGIATRKSPTYFIARLPGGDGSLHWTHLPYQAFLARSFQRGEFPLWNAEMGCGQPVASDPQYKPFNPFFWLFYAWPSAWTFSLGIALMALLGAIGFTLFLRETGLDWVLASMGGLLMAFNPLTTQTVVLSSAWAGWMAGWGLWGCERWAHGKAAGLPVAAGAGALGLYVGHPVCAVLYAGFILGYLWTARERTMRAKLAASGMLAVTLALLVAVQLLPFASGFGLYATYKDAWDGGPFNGWWQIADPTRLIYLPLPLWGLATVGLVEGRPRHRWFFVALVAYGALLMFPLGVPWVVRWGATLAGTVVARYGEEPFWLGIVGLAALGMHRLARGAKEGSPGLPSRLFIIGVSSGCVAAWAISEIKWEILWMKIFRGLALFEIASCLTGVGVYWFLARRGRTGWPAMAGFLPILLLTQFLPANTTRYFTERDPILNPPEVVQAALQSRGTFQWRLSGYYNPREMTFADLSPNQNLNWGLSEIRLVSPIILSDYADFIQHWGTTRLLTTTSFLPRQDPELLKFLGVHFMVSGSELQAPPYSLSLASTPVSLYRVEGALPWVRFADSWQVGRGHDDELRKTFQLLRTSRWRDEAVLDQEPAEILHGVLPDSQAEIRWLEESQNRRALEIKSSSPRLLVIIQNFHPGWKGWIDGRPAKLYRAYGAFQALALPGGCHRVDLRFSEPWFWRGLILSGLGWVLLLGWAAIEIHKGRALP